jgi:signal transduction histidine kinase
MFITYEPVPEAHDIFKRLGKVFEQTYTRFLDLQKAEVQAREAQVETSLERIRSRTMGMQKSNELKDVATLLNKELIHLGITNFASCGYIEIEEKSNRQHSWLTNPDGASLEHFFLPLTGDQIFDERYDAWKRKDVVFKQVVHAKELKKHLDFAYSGFGSQESENIGRNFFPDPTIFYSCNFSYGYLSLITGEMLSHAQELLLARFTRVFEQTYSRFLDLQKAEAQAREAKIEAALERVRSRSMAMHHTSELQDVINTVYLQFGSLNIAITGGAFIAINEESKKEIACWGAGGTADYVQRVHIPFFDRPIYTGLIEDIQKGPGLFTDEFTYEEKIEFFNHIFKYPPNNEAPPERKREVMSREGGYTRSLAVSKNTSVFIINHHGRKFSEEENKILIRFGNVFEQSYTRFLDLQKAEAQAREAKIEAALERVRASTMAMQHSDHLSETAFVLFKQFKELGEAPERIFIATFDNEQDGIIDIWGTNQGGNQLNKLFKVSAEEPTTISKIINAWKEKKRSLIIDLKGEELKQYISFLRSTGIPVSEGIMEDRRVQTIGCFSKGVIGVTTSEPQSAESVQLLERFAGVFDLTYTRFLDLQQAEAQAREAKIEAALERVRSRTMAMQHSNELKDAALLLFQQVQTFGVDQWACGYNIWEADGKTCTAWMSRQGILQPPFKTHPEVDHCFQRFYDAKQRGESFYVEEIGGDEIKTHYQRLLSLPEFKSAPQEFFDEFIAPAFQIFHIAYFDQGYLMFITYKPVPGTWDIFKRFAKVFEQTYTRFLDLQKAEAQAREAKIETGLEKVRSRTMAMQKSDELRETVLVLYEQLQQLNFNSNACNIIIIDKETNNAQYWVSGFSQELFPESYAVPYLNHPYQDVLIKPWKKGDRYAVYEYTGKMKQNFDEIFFTQTEFRNVPEEAKNVMIGLTSVILSTAFISYGALQSLGAEPLSEENASILQRFAKVFEQTYTRFLDLQKAEVQAKEAIKQASVDRIRAEIASMRTTNDLERIQPIIWNELTTLGVPFTRCGVFIMDEDHEKVDTFLSTPEGKSIASFTSNYSDVAVISEALPYWRRKEIYKAHWDEATFLAQAQTLLSQGNITSTETYLTEHRPKDLYLHFLPFLQGILYVGNETPLNDDELQLVQNLADAFSIAYARYEDFNKLELAKEQIENTLTNLKQAQAQLVQSEKMASLGELTAGIAHEIQNPLNFVNNFSEVNTELIAEMKDEIEKGNLEEVKAIANDIADNEHKINHHGKRADAIVKGMLQHSRSSSGVKEPSDINVLADEYLRLAYHGLRAKDKSFNATMKTDFDETIGKINIVPQDVGRSVLNLITNAFYAVSEKKKQNAEGYEPTVRVTTKRINGKVEIRVADNGNGIPQKVLDKIFQPFFTTKPTGQGTGLGLSLSYDIVKAHNGELKVETNEGEGSEFIIFLPANN